MPSRRDFLAAGGCLLLAVAAALPAGAANLPVRFLEGSDGGSERRYPIPSDDSVNVDYGAQVIVVRLQGVMYAFSLACPHQQAAIKWLPKDHRFQCTKHGSRYTEQGVYISGRATRNLDRFAVARDGQQLVVDLRHWFQSDKDPAGWAAASVKLGA